MPQIRGLILVSKLTVNMDHEAFANRAKQALRAQSEGHPEDAAAELRTLLQDLEPATKVAVNDWHQQQALSLLVDALDAAGREEECRSAWEELINFNQSQLTYWQNSLSSARETFAHWNESHSSKNRN
jgi:hypothetical protein